MSDVSSLSDTILPKSDQLNADQLLGGPLNITVTGVKRGTEDQPVVISYEGDNGRPYKPCKSMRKVLIFAWGDDGREWVGKSMTLYNNPDVKFGGVKVGGIRISHLSHIERDIALSLTATKGKKEVFTIHLLQHKPQLIDTAQALETLRVAAEKGMAALKSAWGGTAPELRNVIGPNGCPEDLKAAARAADML